MRFALFGSYGKGNIGDEAIADGIYKSLIAIDAQAQVILFSHNVEESREIHPQFTDIRPMIASGIRSLFRQLASGTWKKSITDLKNCDYIIIGGGGIFHDQETDQKGLSPLFIWWLRSVLFRWLKKPILIWGVGIGPISHQLSPIWLRGILKRAKIITTRDQYSAELAKTHSGIEATIIPDPVWDLFRPLEKNNTHKILGINIRENNRLNQTKTKEMVISCITEIIKTDSFKGIQLIPFATSNPDDRTVMEPLIEELENKFRLPVTITTPSTPKEAFEIVSNCSYFIAMRFHSYIFACAAQVPCSLLSYSKKTDEITKHSVAEYIAQHITAINFWRHQLQPKKD